MPIPMGSILHYRYISIRMQISHILERGMYTHGKTKVDAQLFIRAGCEW